MTDKEKVIKALEVCTAGGSNCDGCPYFEPGKTFLYACTMMDDALALLREQEATEYVDDGLILKGEKRCHQKQKLR